MEFDQMSNLESIAQKLLKKIFWWFAKRYKNSYDQSYSSSSIKAIFLMYWVGVTKLWDT